MSGTLEIHGERYPVVEAELHLPVVDETRYMFLAVYVGPDEPELGFALWEVEVPFLQSIDDLDGQRVHVHPGGEGYDDDTLATDIIGMNEDLSYWSIGLDDGGCYGEIQIDFVRVKAREYRCHVRCTLSEEDPEINIAQLYDILGTADFVVTVDEVDPYADSR